MTNDLRLSGGALVDGDHPEHNRGRGFANHWRTRRKTNPVAAKVFLQKKCPPIFARCSLTRLLPTIRWWRRISSWIPV